MLPPTETMSTMSSPSTREASWPEHHERVLLCHINSGQTGRFAHSRGVTTFQRIPDYPARRSGSPAKEVVELVVDYAVPDIARQVVCVERMRSDEVLGLIWER